MIHQKNYFSHEIQSKVGSLFIEGPITVKQLEQWEFHKDLNTFRPANRQKEALKTIIERPEGRIYVARHVNTIVGYVAYIYPDTMERWSKAQLDNLIELGAIEVCPSYRGYSLAKHLIYQSMKDDAMDDYIVISTEYYWHWDLKNTGVTMWQYRSILERIMNNAGLYEQKTTDPEIASHPVNSLMVRIGSRVDEISIEQFNKIRLMKTNYKLY